MKINFFKKREKAFLVLDVGTEAVKSIIAIREGNKINILSSSLNYLDESVKFEKEVDPQDLETEIIKKSIKDNLEQVFRNFALLPKKDKIDIESLPALILLPCSILKAKVIDCSFERESFQKKISSEEMGNIYGEIFRQAKEKTASSFFKKTGIIGKDLEWIGLKIVSSKIEGYSISSIKGYKGKKLSFKVLTIFALRDYFNKLNKIFHGLDLNVLKIVHLSEVLPVVFRGKLETALFVDFGGRYTQAFLIRDGNICFAEEIERGSWNFSQRLGDILAIERDQARILKEKYAEGILSPEVSERIKDALSFEKPVWRNWLKSLSEFQKCPVYFMGGGSGLKEIRSIFRERKILKPKNFKKSVIFDEYFDSSQFVPCLLTSLFKNAK